MVGDSVFNKHAQNLLFESHDFLKQDQVTLLEVNFIKSNIRLQQSKQYLGQVH